jgi:hypothetical protein
MKEKKKGLKKIFLIGVLMFAISLWVYPYLSENKAEDAYVEPEGRSILGTVTISGLIVEGAGYFFDANSSVQKLM